MAFHQEAGAYDTQQAAIQIDHDFGCPGQPISVEQVIRTGQEAWVRLSSGLTWTDWVLVGTALQVGQAEAMRTAHTNRPEGRRFNTEYGVWLKSTGFDRIDKATRSRLSSCLKNLCAIEQWIATVPVNKRVTLNHPHTIWRAWQSTQTPKPADTPPRVSHVEKLKQALIETQEENARLQREIDSGGGDLWRPDDSAKSIAKVWAATLPPAKMDAIIREYRKLRKESERAE